MRTGYGLIDSDGRRSRAVAWGVIELGGAELAGRLGRLLDTLSALIETHRPAAAAVEEVFVARNPASALKLGQARGVVLAACMAGGLEVHEYAARQVKLAVVGRGAAAKAQVQHMVRVLLALPETPPPDAADALALALCHSHHRAGGYNGPAPVRRRRAGRWRVLPGEGRG
ncbi:MAG: crossover junction endodeoxyribonuclease RuvC [Gammaproteobacteria bacterium]|nr:MAG: crossover junction endodeoxyribonuclease RuvC [Gammaproteobacteria bacterium]